MALQYYQILTIIFLALISRGKAIPLRQDYSPRQELDDVMNTDDLYEIQRKFGEQNPSFLANWPWLRDILPEYEISTNRIILPERTPVFEIPEPLPTPMPVRRTQVARENILKDQGQKKNNNYYRSEYMSPCHFKICNMGRKRNVRFLQI